MKSVTITERDTGAGRDRTEEPEKRNTGMECERSAGSWGAFRNKRSYEDFYSLEQGQTDRAKTTP